MATLNKIDSGSKIGLTMIAVDAGGAKNQKIVSTVVTTNGRLIATRRLRHGPSATVKPRGP